MCYSNEKYSGAHGHPRKVSTTAGTATITVPTDSKHEADITGCGVIALFARRQRQKVPTAGLNTNQVFRFVVFVSSLNVTSTFVVGVLEQ